MTSYADDALVGRLVDGRYRIVSHLAHGGMASVYVATDERLDRRVALKVIRPTFASDPHFLERFRGEARAVARLNHPAIVAVHDQGEGPEGAFLVMELVDGQTLRDVITNEAPLSPREALAILEPILEALAMAHRHGIIHRDIKPENVLIGSHGEVKVADFGLARAVSEASVVGHSGTMLGTVSYVAPEQVERGFADERSDLYAAGLVFFEMLTGRKAVQGDNPIQIAYAHVHKEVAAPSQVAAGVPAPLDRLSQLLTARDPADRPASGDLALTALAHERAALSPSQLDHRAVPSAAVATTQIHHPEPQSSGAATQRIAVADAPSTAPVTAPPMTAPTVTAAPREFHESARPTQPPTGPPRNGHVDGAPDSSHTQELSVRHARPRRRRWPWALLALLLLGGGGVGWYTLFGPGSMTIVPAVIGSLSADAEQTLTKSELRPAVQEVFSETKPKGVVLDANPKPGDEVSKNSTVTLSVSKGPERYAVPALVGKAQTEAAPLLQATKLTLGKTTKAYSETVAAGKILSTDPKPGNQLKKGTAVNITVSQGKQPIPVPDLRGLTRDQAVAKLKGLGLVSAEADQVNSDTVPKGQVISQSPASGTLFKGQTVTITVSKGPVMVDVPDLTGSSEKDARQTLKKLGFKVSVEYVLGSPILDLVRGQSAIGPAPKGSTITISVV